MKTITINGHNIGQGHPCYIVAEIGVNHNGCLKTALELVDAAKEAGADAVKIQTWNTDAICSTASKQYWGLKRMELSQGSFRVIRDHAKKRKIDFFTTPDDIESAIFAATNGAQAFKIGSGGLSPELIQFIGGFACNKIRSASRIGNKPYHQHLDIPVIMSTGMSDWPKVRRSVKLLESTGCKFALMHCVSAYPAMATDMNLAMIRKLETFGVPVGLSDHSCEYRVAEAAIAAGAKLYEAHITLDNFDKRGPDHRMSWNYTRFMELVGRIRAVEEVMGDGKKLVLECERGTMKILEGRKP